MKPFVLTLILLCSFLSNAQVPETSELYKIITSKDSILFNSGLNKCNLKPFKKLLTEDLKFFHDKSGITSGKEAFLENLKTGLCSSGKKFHLKRELVKSSTQIYPLKKNGELYGAIQTGTHNFYLIEGEKEKFDGSANFTHVWLLKNNDWKIDHVLSYNHQPYMLEDIDSNQKSENSNLELQTILNQYVGHYKLQKRNSASIELKNNQLIVSSGELVSRIVLKEKDLYQIKEMNLEFQFIRNNTNDVVKFFVIENGKKVDEATKTL